MKKLINLFALVMLVGVNALTPISYAQETLGDDTGIIENELEYYSDSQQNEEEEDFPQIFQEDDMIQILESEEYETDTQPLEMDIQEVDNSEEIDEGLVQVQNLNITEIDLNNPIHLYRNWELTWTYTWLTQAINESESGDVVKLIDDISVSTTSVISWKSLTIDGDNHTITRIANIRTITVNEGSSLKLLDITITDNAVNFAPNRYNSLLNAATTIPLCLWWVNETRNESWDVIASVCATENVDTAKTNPQIYSAWDIYGDNLTISNSLNSNWSAAIIVVKWWIEMINSSFIHNWASGTSNAWRGWAIRIWPNTATNIVEESPITKIIFSWCLFESNYWRMYGGALSLQYPPEVITIDNCIFSGNTAHLNGWAIHVPNIRSKPTWYLPKISTWSTMPIGTLYINNSDFYSNWCGNDGAAIENDDLFLEINWAYFEHNYWTQPENTSVWVVSCQAWWYDNPADINNRWGIHRKFKINNSEFKDSNTVVLWDHNAEWSFYVDNCSFEDQDFVILSYNAEWWIKNSTIKNSNPFWNCGKTWYFLRDIDIIPYTDYVERAEAYWKSTFRLENNTYSNNCPTNEYFQIRNIDYSTWINNIIIEDELDTRVLVHRLHYDSSNIQWTDEIYYGATINDGKVAYIKKNKFYNFDEFNAELENFSYSNSGYQLESWKAMLFYLDTGLTELWSGSIPTTTNLYWKKTDIYNITYEWTDWVNFEWITHTYKFINLNHTQYLTELTPYKLNTPSRNWYRFKWRFLDSEYTIPVTSIELWTTWDITLYAKWEKVWSSGWGWWGGWGWNSNNSDTPKEDNTPTETPEQPSQDGSNTQDSQPNGEDSEQTPENDKNTENSSDSEKSTEWQNNSDEFQQAYEFAKKNGITTMSTIQKAQMYTPLTRIAMAKMLSQYAINILWQTPDKTRINKFNDVTEKMNSDYDEWVTLAYQLWIMWQNMPWNNFRPNDEVTRAEFMTALSRLLYSTSDGEYKSTYKYYTHHMEKLKDEWIVTNTNPSMKERRWYVMIMLMRSAGK